jgi:hypothetical protein
MRGGCGGSGGRMARVSRRGEQSNAEQSAAWRRCLQKDSSPTERGPCQGRDASARFSVFVLAARAGSAFQASRGPPPCHGPARAVASPAAYVPFIPSCARAVLQTSDRSTHIYDAGPQIVCPGSHPGARMRLPIRPHLLLRQDIRAHPRLVAKARGRLQ